MRHIILEDHQFSSCQLLSGAVVAILRVVEKLSPRGDEEIEDDNVESLQASQRVASA